MVIELASLIDIDPLSPSICPSLDLTFTIRANSIPCFFLLCSLSLLKYLSGISEGHWPFSRRQSSPWVFTLCSRRLSTERVSDRLASLELRSEEHTSELQSRPH